MTFRVRTQSALTAAEGNTLLPLCTLYIHSGHIPLRTCTHTSQDERHVHMCISPNTLIKHTVHTYICSNTSCVHLSLLPNKNHHTCIHMFMTSVIHSSQGRKPPSTIHNTWGSQEAIVLLSCKQ